MVLSVDGSVVATKNAAPWDLTWNTLDPLNQAFNGAHDIKVEAVDSSGGSTESALRSVTVSNNVISGAPGPFKATFFLNEVGSSNHTAFVVPPMIETDRTFTTSTSEGSSGTTGGTGTTGTKTGTLSQSPSCDTCSGSGGTTQMSGQDKKSGGKVEQAIAVVTAPPSGDPVSTYGFKLDVDVKNESLVAWKSNTTGTGLQLWYRWYTDDGVVLFEGPGTRLLPVDAPAPADQGHPGDGGAARRCSTARSAAALRLRFDIFDSTNLKWFAMGGNAPSDNPVIVDKELSENLGLERFWQYEQVATGAGSAAYVNADNGNMLWRWSPWATPGRGIASIVDLTYNSLEEHSDSPAGENVSLEHLRPRPVRLASRHPPQPGGQEHGQEHPLRAVHRRRRHAARVHRHRELLRRGGVDRARGRQPLPAQLPQHDRPAEVLGPDAPGQPDVLVRQRGLPAPGPGHQRQHPRVPPREHPERAGPGRPEEAGRRRSSTRRAAPASYEVNYYDKDEVKGGRVRGNVEWIKDHSGSLLMFDYYDDGNLMRVTQRGGTTTDGVAVADRSFVFTYTTPNGDAPALTTLDQRKNPPQKVTQSVKLYSVLDPLQNETAFTYWGAQPDPKNRWKLKTWADRLGNTSTFSHDYVARVMTAALPLNRTYKYGYDTQGRVTKMTNAEG